MRGREDVEATRVRRRPRDGRQQRWPGPAGAHASRMPATLVGARPAPRRARLRRPRRPQIAVGGEAGVALEVARRPRSVWGPKMPSTRPASKPRAPELALQLGHVVAAQHAGCGRYSSRSPRPVAGLDQGGPGLVAAHAVGARAAGGLEGTDRRVGGLAVRAPGSSADLRTPAAVSRCWRSRTASPARRLERQRQPRANRSGRRSRPWQDRPRGTR